MNAKVETNLDRRTARIVGALFIVATVTGILSVAVLSPILDAQDYLINVSANETQVVVGALLELTMAVAIGAIPVMLFSILKRHSDGVAVGYVVARVLEAVMVAVAALMVLSLPTPSHEYAQAGAPDAAHLQALGAWMSAARDWADLIGTQIFFSLTALILNYSLHQSGLVPRFLSVWGLIGAVLILAAGLLAMFGLVTPFSTISILLYLPIALQEMIFAVWLIVRGFDSSAIASQSAKEA